MGSYSILTVATSVYAKPEEIRRALRDVKEKAR
jgi:hypothetical protein